MEQIELLATLIFIIIIGFCTVASLRWVLKTKEILRSVEYTCDLQKKTIEKLEENQKEIVQLFNKLKPEEQ